MEKRNQKILILALFLGLNCFLNGKLNSQSCYVRLFDASGITISSEELTLLENTACRLRDSLPVEYRDSFQVYDLGVYTIRENTPGGTRAIFDKALQDIKNQSKYYVVFGRQSSSIGINIGFWVQINLPNLGNFYCFSQENPNFNYDLSHKYQFITNTFHKENGLIPYLYALAEKDAMEHLAAQIGKIIRCCHQNIKICDVCLLTTEEIRNYLVGQGYTATPVKILNSNPARKDSVKNKSNLPRIADLCSDIMTIEIDGTVCNDFPAVISHIMQAYPDEIGEAKISDDFCLCSSGGLEYFNAGPPYIGTQHIRLKIHISRGIVGIPGQEEDVIYSQIFAPYELGTLPFNAYIPNRISESSSSTPPERLGNLDMNYVKSTVESIFSKNGMSLSSISLQKPIQPYKQYDIYNGLVWTKINPPPSAGRSKYNFSIVPDPSHFELSGNFVEFHFFNGSFNIFSNNNHLNYAIGHHFAHELLHQMIGMSLGYFKEYGLLVGTYAEPNIESFYSAYGTAGHTNDQLNLLLEGAYFNANNINTCNFITEEQKSKLRNLSGWQGQVKHLLPNKITSDYQQMEQISPGIKALFTYHKIMRSLLETYPDKTSCEIVCGSKILVNTIKMMKLQEYDGF